MDIHETIRKIAMAGVGAVSLTAQKSKELIDSLIQRGESTSAEKNISYEEIRDRLAAQLSALSEKMRAEIDRASFEELLSRVDSLTDLQRAQLYERLTAAKSDSASDAAEADAAFSEGETENNPDDSEN